MGSVKHDVVLFCHSGGLDISDKEQIQSNPVTKIGPGFGKDFFGTGNAYM